MQSAVTPTQDPSVAFKATPAKDDRLLFAIVAALAVAGMIVSGVSLQRHYAKSASAFCEFGEKFSCDVVNRSEYSSVLGIPVAGIGVVGYGTLLILATIYRSRPEMPTRLLALAIAGLGFALYLTYVEGYVLETWCVLCLSSLGVIAGIAMLAGVVKARKHL
jgi:vitamin-K-epoxide reductase (warfarin-sensitive)